MKIKNRKMNNTYIRLIHDENNNYSVTASMNGIIRAPNSMSVMLSVPIRFGAENIFDHCLGYFHMHACMCHEQL